MGVLPESISVFVYKEDLSVVPFNVDCFYAKYLGIIREMPESANIRTLILFMYS